LTLIQTGKVLHFPIVLFDTHYWTGMLDWVRDKLLHDGLISPGDVDLLSGHRRRRGSGRGRDRLLRAPLCAGRRAGDVIDLRS